MRNQDFNYATEDDTFPIEGTFDTNIEKKTYVVSSNGEIGIYQIQNN